MLLWLAIGVILCMVLVSGLGSYRYSVQYEKMSQADAEARERIEEQSLFVVLNYTDEERRTDSFLVFLTVLGIPVIILGCTAAASLQFYRARLKKPLGLLREASVKIAASDLDFSIQYHSQDEMGKLCASFETMRAALYQNNQALWRAMEERKRVNAAFAHDLRTPLTVLRGYGEILESYLPREDFDRKKAADMAGTITAQVARLEKFANDMTALSKLEDRPVLLRDTDMRALAEKLKENFKVLAAQAGISLEADLTGVQGTGRADEAMIAQAAENLASNALRYAKCQVRVSFLTNGSLLVLRVADDGPGYPAQVLESAANGRQAPGGGLGLSIVQVLCRKHGGRLDIQNSPEGAIAQAFFRLDMQKAPDGLA